MSISRVIKNECFDLIVCVFVSGFSSHLDNFHSNKDFTNTGEGLHILTNGGHL